MSNFEAMNAASAGIFASIVTFNDRRFLEACLSGLCAQEGFSAGAGLLIHVRDNASTDEWPAQDLFADRVVFHRNDVNLGFCAAHNQGVSDFLRSGCGFMLIMNADVRLEKDALRNLAAELAASDAGYACPCLFRADDDLNPLRPLTIDSTGILFTSALRHFDRAQGEIAGEVHRRSGYVDGASGACILMKRAFVEALLLRGNEFDADLGLVYPRLMPGREARAPLFDEAFFAYREDADLAWRARALGWRCIYAASARGCHRRVVTPERRAALDPAINLWSVRNRFLMQINNFSWRRDRRSILPGLLLRNLTVVSGVLALERASLPALGQVWKLRRRARERRRLLFERQSSGS